MKLIFPISIARSNHAQPAGSLCLGHTQPRFDFLPGTSRLRKDVPGSCLGRGSIKVPRGQEDRIGAARCRSRRKLGVFTRDLQAKLNPYLRPLLDALNEMLDYDQVKYLMEHDVIEVIPLAYMRGRTLNEAFIILDEAQNTTTAQMKMFLTRMGEGSKIVVSGDVTQVDLPSGVLSGMRDAWRRLQGLENVAFVTLAQQDIVRHRLVQAIVGRYEQGSSHPSDDDPEPTVPTQS